MIPRLKPQLGLAEMAAALRFGGADDIALFEHAFATLMGQSHAVAFPYGRTGLIVLLEALGITDMEVICPAYTCVVVPHAIRYSGNEPVFVDSAASGFNMDLSLVAEAIGPRTKALIATSIFGYPVDLDALGQIRERHPDLRIIQDCAHSFGAEWNGRPVQQFGDAAIFGLNASKLLTSIFGGMVTTDDARLAERLRRLRDDRLQAPAAGKTLRRVLYLLALYPAFGNTFYGLVNRLERSGILDRFVRYYDEAKVDMPGDYLEGMTAVEARVGLAQTRRYADVIERRRRNARYYLDHLPVTEAVQLPPWSPGATYSHFVPLTKTREKILSEGLRVGVQFGRLIEYNIPRLSAYQSARFVDRGIADMLSSSALNLPIHCRAVKELDRVIDVYAQAVSH